MEIQQSLFYAKYIRALRWQIGKLDGQYIFFKWFPFLGGLAKLQRCTKLPSVQKTIRFINANKIGTLAAEPDIEVSQSAFTTWCNRLHPHVRFSQSHFLPTKTILIDLSAPEKVIFNRFSEAKRRGVRRAIKLGVTVGESCDIDALIKIKNKSAGFLGFITTTGIDKLWRVFGPKRAAILIASIHKPKVNLSKNARAQTDKKIIGGLLMLFWDKIAYYWIAGATHAGKKLYAPTLLVWEALKLSKKRGCTAFDFLGVWDERMPEKNHEWLGFTKFKQGFGGQGVYYPISV